MAEAEAARKAAEEEAARKAAEEEATRKAAEEAARKAAEEEAARKAAEEEAARKAAEAAQAQEPDADGFIETPITGDNAISFKCTTCGQEIIAPGEAVGYEAECPACGAILLVPASSEPGTTYAKDGSGEQKEVVSVDDILLDSIKVTAYALFRELFVSALRSYFGAGCEINLKISSRKNHGSYISSVHYNVCCLSQLLLKLHELFPDIAVHAAG